MKRLLHCVLFVRPCTTREVRNPHASTKSPCEIMCCRRASYRRSQSGIAFVCTVRKTYFAWCFVIGSGGGNSKQLRFAGVIRKLLRIQSIDAQAIIMTRSITVPKLDMMIVSISCSPLYCSFTTLMKLLALFFSQALFERTWRISLINVHHNL